MNIYMSIMGQEILVSTDDQRIISYIQDVYACYISRQKCSMKFLKRLDMDMLLSSNTKVEKMTAVDNAIVNLVNSDEQYYLLHAGVLLLDDQAFLICGKTKSGKSTACFLLQSLYDYVCVSDDLAFINKNNLRVSSIFRPVKLRQPVVRKYNLLQKVVFCEYDSDGTERYKLANQNCQTDCNQQDAEIKAIIGIEYVPDETVQSIEEIRGIAALQSLLLNSYMQDRLKNSYGVITDLIRKTKIFKVKYSNPAFLNNIMIDLSKKGDQI